MRALAVVVMVVFLSACATVPSSSRPMDYYQGQNDAYSSDVSLFGDSSVGMSEEDINKILAYRLVLPTQNRLAILNLTPSNYWRYYSSDFVHLNEALVNDFIGELKASARIYDASFLPSLLIPEKKTLPHLRLAAARFQADVLLTYRTNCQSFEKYKFLDPDETKAYCTVEAVALDVRSGIVPFTVVSTNEFKAERKPDDMNFDETMRKAEMSATTVGLTKVAEELRRFIESMPSL